MIHSYVSKKNRVYRYYVCVKAHQRGWAQCETRSVSAPALEDAVLDQLRGIGRNPTVLRAVLRQIEEQRQRDVLGIQRERADAELELKRIAQEMSSVVPMAGTIQSATDRLAELQDRAKYLDNRVPELLSQMARIEAEAADPKEVEAALQEFDPLWEQLSTWEQERFIRALVDQVRYDGKTGTVTVGFRSSGARNLCDWAADRFRGTQE
jgi:site-specific DNA recombinase